MVDIGYVAVISDLCLLEKVGFDAPRLSEGRSTLPPKKLN